MKQADGAAPVPGDPAQFRSRPRPVRHLPAAGDDGHGGAGPAAHPGPGPHVGRDAGPGAPAEHAGRWVAHAAGQGTAAAGTQRS